MTLMSDIIIDHYTGVEMTHVMDPVPEQETWIADRRAEDAHYHWRTFKCQYCGKVYSLQVIEGNTITCPDCEDNDEQ